MISFTAGQTIFTKLSLNNSTDNQTLYGLLANIEHRYLLQKYFSNEGSYSIQTIGQTSLMLASGVPIGSTSCTLNAAWPYQTTQAQLTFSDGEVVNAQFTNGSTTATWQPATVGILFYTVNSISAGATSATLAAAWTQPTGSYVVSFSDGSTKTVTLTLNATTMTWSGGLAQNVLAQFNTSTIAASSNASIGGVQFYPMPPNYSKLKDITITVGVLKWTLTEVRTREEWDNLNVFPYYASIPSKFFIYPGGDKGGQIGIWPIPSTTGNVITFNYKFRVPDLSLPDYVSTIGVAKGTVSVSNGSMAITGVGTSFIPTTNIGNESRWIQFNNIKSDGTAGQGDNLWYQIQNISSTTGITLYQPYQGNTIAGASDYVIGQCPLIAEDFQDLLPWKVLEYYYTSIKANEVQANKYDMLYKEKLELLAEYSGSNTINVNLSPKRAFRGNPNAFPYNSIGK